MGYCVRCDRRWNGLAEAHCSGCCEHFSSVFAFDKHRFGKEDTRRCLTIEEMLAKKMVYDTESRKWVSGAMINRSFLPSGKQQIQ